MKISVITVSFNAVDRIERTIRSVVQQDYCDYEFIVIDGGSKDGTVDVIKKYNDLISFWISEPDTGIYNAMNKGVGRAIGDYCIFMNAGDMFCSSTVLTKISQYLDDEKSIVMGNQIYLNAKGRFSLYGRCWNEITEKRLFFDSLYHQASFIRRKDLIDTPYDESFRMVSDWKEAIELLLVQKKQYLGVDIDVDFFFQDGVTATNRELGKKERRIVLDQYFSQEQHNAFQAEMKAYKNFWNVPRYVNFISKCIGQTIKRFSIKTPALN